MTQSRSAAVERIAGSLADAGLARSPARVFAALLLDDDGRATSAELVDSLGMSPAGVSGAVRYLTPLGFVRREREPGSRRDVYVVDDDAWRTAMLRHDQLYRPIRAALDAGAVAVAGSPAQTRLELASEFLDFVESELDGILERWLAHQGRLAGE